MSGQLALFDRPMTALGITAPRGGITPVQDVALQLVLATCRARGATAFHHGDCIGGDVRGAQVAAMLGYHVVGHPSYSRSERARGLDGYGTRAFFPSHTTCEALPYLQRDRVIVDTVDLLIGLPPCDAWQPRSGTWYTIDYAQRRGRPRVVIAPDGRLLDAHDAGEALHAVLRDPAMLARAVDEEFVTPQVSHDHQGVNREGSA
jgi:hypothetical protein